MFDISGKISALNMISEIKEVLKMLHGLYNSHMNKKKEDFYFYVTNIFEKSKMISNNYVDVLSSLRFNLIYNQWYGEESLEYLMKLEYDLKNERIYIREVLKSLNKVYDGKLENFVGGIFQIMYCEKVNRHHTKDMEHRFSSLIRDARAFQYNSTYKQDFLSNINQMLYDVNQAWLIVCHEYLLLKEENEI